MINLENTQLIGHRGARGEVLENTLSGFQHASRLRPRGLAGIEFDVQLTADEHLVIFHDETLQRLCGLQSRIDQLSLIEIQRQLQSGHQIISLDMLAQALPSSTPQKHTLNNLFGGSRFDGSRFAGARISDNTNDDSLTTAVHKLAQFTHIELEIKTHPRTNYSKLVGALARYLVDTPLAGLPIVLTSFDLQLLAQLQRNKLLTHMPRGLLAHTPELLATAPNKALQLGCTRLGVYYPLLTQSVIQHCHRHNLPVSAWTVNDIDSIKQLVKWQVDVIITDIPTQLL
ncbi:glycerophosphoryl diester phosphodiesterase [Psychrobacter sp. PL15]|uniref:glycerophosphodiester phosphodiesterase n=1 Tax=Psychrobacter sp. PL15 TaxID=3071719 RepID=UPI002E02F923|nr:glycerophosphoryl diester phosphodiesterase [Psychrobacter sp. PL15]